jgi:hypothetical protein
MSILRSLNYYMPSRCVMSGYFPAAANVSKVVVSPRGSVYDFPALDTMRVAHVQQHLTCNAPVPTALKTTL